MKSRKLNQHQRLWVALLYVITIIISYSVLGGKIADILNQTEHASVWFFSGILLVVMGKYVTEQIDLILQLYSKSPNFK